QQIAARLTALRTAETGTLNPRLPQRPFNSGGASVPGSSSWPDAFGATSYVAKRRKCETAPDPLTTREPQIILVLSQGMTNKGIGQRLRLAEGSRRYTCTT